MDKLSLFATKNRFKTESDSRPAYTGGLVLKENQTLEAGIPYDIAVWINDNTGSLSVKIHPMSEDQAKKYLNWKSMTTAHAKDESRSVEIYPKRESPEQNPDFSNMDACGNRIVQFPPATKVNEIKPIDDADSDLPF